MLGLSLLAAFAAPPVQAQTDWREAVAQCRRLESPTARLACYDAMNVAERPASRPAATGAAAATPALPANEAARFGFESRDLPQRQEALESTIPGAFEGWGAGDRIRLANGQVWQISDDSAGVVYAKDPKIRIRRGALGAFYLEIAGTNRSPKVRRVE